MDFLANENFPMPSVRRLREAGHDVAAIASEESGVSDERVLERAVAESRIILTFDRDYGRLIFDFGLPAPPGVLYFRFVPASLTEPAERLLELMDGPDFAIPGNFIVVESDRLRRRVLPPAP